MEFFWIQPLNKFEKKTNEKKKLERPPKNTLEKLKNGNKHN